MFRTDKVQVELDFDGSRVLDKKEFDKIICIKLIGLIKIMLSEPFEYPIILLF